ncbi:nucleotide exchange factor GrpE [Candidatus Woesearchaeota archaeon]|nr:nucleotide exchange factor GrpE [Candidatus Woesearchaeota archaeon]
MKQEKKEQKPPVPESHPKRDERDDRDETSSGREAGKEGYEKTLKGGSKEDDSKENGNEENNNKKYDNKENNNKESDIKEQKIADLTESLQRLQAEFENYKKYVQRQQQEIGKYSRADVLEKILPIVDSFTMALQHTASREEFIKGMELLYSQLWSMLEQEGVRPIECAGKKVDPFTQDVLLVQEDEGPEDVVLEELQKGYMLNDKVLRHAKVKISKKSSKPGNAGNKSSGNNE